MTPPKLLTIGETADLMTQLGYPIAAPTLRTWRKNWIKGDRKGPTPLLLNARRLRYDARDVEEVTRELLAAARRAAKGDGKHSA